MAFGHQKRTGKDTASGFAMTHLRSNSRVRRVEKRGFADKLKQVCYELYAWAGMMPGPWYEEPANQHRKEAVLPQLGKTPRQIWIAIGNGIRDLAYEPTWIDYLLNSTPCDFLIVSDMRFPVEAQKIKSLGGIVVKIVRPDVPHTSDAADDPLLYYKGWDHTITNHTGNMNALYNDVVQIVEGMFDARMDNARDSPDAVVL